MEDLKNLIDLAYLEKALTVIKTYVDDKSDIFQVKLTDSIDSVKAESKANIQDLDKSVTNLSIRVAKIETKDGCECKPVGDLEFKNMIDSVVTEFELGTKLIDAGLLICEATFGSVAPGANSLSGGVR